MITSVNSNLGFNPLSRLPWGTFVEYDGNSPHVELNRGTIESFFYRGTSLTIKTDNPQALLFHGDKYTFRKTRDQGILTLKDPLYCKFKLAPPGVEIPQK